MFELDPGARVEVRRGSEPVLLARLQGEGAGGEGAEIGAPFTDRLVEKFGLPVAGWRGRGAVSLDSVARIAVSRGDEEPGGDA